MSEPADKPVLTYAQGGFDRPLRGWTLLRVFDVLVGIHLGIVNSMILTSAVKVLQGGPAPQPVDAESGPATLAVWQYWATAIDAAISIALVVLLFAAAWAMRRGRDDRRPWMLHLVYAAIKVTLVLTSALLYAWDVDKTRLDWGVFGSAFMVGLIHPILMLSLLAQIRTEMWRRGATA